MRVHPSCFVLFTLLSLAVVAEDQWAETSTLSAPDARKIPQIVQLAEKAFRLVKPLADQTNVETNTPLNENSASPGQTSSTVLAQAASQVMGDTAETFVVFKLPESGDFKAWLFIVLCLGIVVFSILFEVGLHAVRHAVMNLHGWKHVFQKVVLAGLVGTLAERLVRCRSKTNSFCWALSHSCSSSATKELQKKTTLWCVAPECSLNFCV